MPDGFDMNAFDAQWAAEQAAETPEESELMPSEEEAQGVLEDENYGENPEVEELDSEEIDEEDEIPADAPPINDPDADKRNATFAAMRRERDEALAQSAFLQQIADQNGLTVDELKQRYADARLEEQSEEQGVPVEVLQRLQSLEQENSTMKQQSFSARFNSEVEATIEKYKVNETDLEATFAYAQQNGLTDSLKAGTTNFEAVHKMAHMDALIEKQVQAALQGSLTEKKKRQKEASISHASGGGAVETSLEDQATADAKRLIDEGF